MKALICGLLTAFVSISSFAAPGDKPVSKFQGTEVVNCKSKPGTSYDRELQVFAEMLPSNVADEDGIYWSAGMILVHKFQGGSEALGLERVGYDSKKVVIDFGNGSKIEIPANSRKPISFLNWGKFYCALK